MTPVEYILLSIALSWGVDTVVGWVTPEPKAVCFVEEQINGKTTQVPRHCDELTLSIKKEQ